MDRSEPRAKHGDHYERRGNRILKDPAIVGPARPILGASASENTSLRRVLQRRRWLGLQSTRDRNFLSPTSDRARDPVVPNTIRANSQMRGNLLAFAPIEFFRRGSEQEALCKALLGRRQACSRLRAHQTSQFGLSQSHDSQSMPAVLKPLRRSFRPLYIKLRAFGSVQSIRSAISLPLIPCRYSSTAIRRFVASRAITSSTIPAILRRSVTRSGDCSGSAASQPPVSGSSSDVESSCSSRLEMTRRTASIVAETATLYI